MFEYVESAWVQVGAAITDEGGWALKLTVDGSRIAAGAFRSDGSGGFMLSGVGTTRVFDLAACGPTREPTTAESYSYVYTEAPTAAPTTETAPPSSTELRDSSGNYLFTKDPTAEPPCCQQWGLASSYAQQYGTAWPLVFDGSCSGGSIKTVQEWLDFATLGWSTSPDGLCLADGFYTMSYDPAP